MKIFQINSVCGIRSTGRIATDLYHVLKCSGHSCKVAYGRETARNIDECDVVKIGGNFGIYLHGFLSRITDRTGFYSTIATKRLIKKIREFDPDVIHLHNLHGYYINVEILFRFLAKYNKKVVWTLHDCWSFTGHCSHFALIGCEKWKTGCRKCPKKKSYPTSLFLDNSKRNWKRKRELFTNVGDMTIVTPSKWLADLVKQSYLNKYPIKVINNGIDLELFKTTEGNFRERYGLKDKKLILGVASAWGRTKGLCDFVKLSDMLDDNYKIVLVGLKEKQMKEMPDSILCISRTDSVKELAEIYSECDVFVNLTYQDVLGMVNVEALACGTPVITYNSGGSPECIDESCGLVAEQGDLDTVCKMIEEVCNKNIFEKEDCILSSKRFDKQARYKDYINLYEGVI